MLPGGIVFGVSENRADVFQALASVSTDNNPLGFPDGWLGPAPLPFCTGGALMKWRLCEHGLWHPHTGMNHVSLLNSQEADNLSRLPRVCRLSPGVTEPVYQHS